jgi:exopolysaccharide production protein ExoQ
VNRSNYYIPEHVPVEAISEKQNSRKKFLSNIEMIFGIVGILFFAGAFTAGLSIFFPSVIITLIRYGILMGSLLALLLNWRKTLYRVFRSFWIWVLIGLLFHSVFWSATPAETSTQLRAELFPMTTFSLYLATRFSLSRLFDLICLTLGLGTFLSLLLAIFIPHVAIHSGDNVHAGAWKGIYIQKNTFGAYTVLAANTFYLRAIYQKKRKLFAWSLLGVTIFIILLSQSKTALTLLIVSILCTTLYIFYRWRGKRTILFLDVFIMLLTVTCILLVQNWTNILGLLGRGEHISGRTVIWSFLFDQRIPQSFWFGYGRGAFWSNPNLTYGLKLVPAHAHNGFVEILLDIGFVGFIAFAICFFLAYIRALKLSYCSESAYRVWPIVFLTLLITNNITESLLTNRVNLFWILFVTIALAMDNRTINRIRSDL